MENFQREKSNPLLLETLLENARSRAGALMNDGNGIRTWISAIFWEFCSAMIKIRAPCKSMQMILYSQRLKNNCNRSKLVIYAVF